jgi:hypothetical protein
MSLCDTWYELLVARLLLQSPELLKGRVRWLARRCVVDAHAKATNTSPPSTTTAAPFKAAVAAATGALCALDQCLLAIIDGDGKCLFIYLVYCLPCFSLYAFVCVCFLFCWSVCSVCALDQCLLAIIDGDGKACECVFIRRCFFFLVSLLLVVYVSVSVRSISACSQSLMATVRHASVFLFLLFLVFLDACVLRCVHSIILNTHHSYHTHNPALQCMLRCVCAIKCWTCVGSKRTWPIC